MAMPLKLTLGKGEKLIVNGAVVKNDGDPASLVFENQAQILRQKDILSSDAAQTPASRVYLALQCAYLFPDRRSSHIDDFDQLLRDYVTAAPSAQAIADDIMEKVKTDQLYSGLKVCQRLIEHESGILQHVE